MVFRCCVCVSTHEEPDSTQTRAIRPSSSQHEQRRSSAGGTSSSGRPPGGGLAIAPPRILTGSHASNNDLSITAAILDSTKSTNAGTSRNSEQRRQGYDADIALAWRLAQEEQERAWQPSQLEPMPQRRPFLAGATPSSARVQPSQFGNPVSLPPPPPGQRPNLALAAALADSDYAARQVVELEHANETAFKAEFDLALEASLATVSYDDVLRDIKLWTIDLVAATDDVMAALDSMARHQREVADKLEAALMDNSDDRRILKLTWTAEQLSAAENRLRRLADQMAPVGMAVAELQDLRDVLLRASLSVPAAEKQRDDIIERLFRNIGSFGLKPKPASREAGEESVSMAAAPADLRDYISAMIEDAARLPKMPRSEKSPSSSSAAMLRPLREGLGTPELVSEGPKHRPITENGVDQPQNSPDGNIMNISPSKWASPEDDGSLTANSIRSEEEDGVSRRLRTGTSPVPFHLSTGRPRYERTGIPIQVHNLRRIPALISLQYELHKDRGVVSEAVGWTRTVSKKGGIRPVALEPRNPPLGVETASFSAVDELVDFVRENGGILSTFPARFDSNDRWSVIRAAAEAYHALHGASQQFEVWEVSSDALFLEDCRRLVKLVSLVSAQLAAVASATDPLRVALTKHKLPWNQSIVSEVRWAVQNAAAVTMRQGVLASQEAERVRGSWQRQAVLRPLGYAVMAAAAAHQLAGGFNNNSGTVCDQLIERTVHYARLIDPKWFRGTKVVAL